MAQSIKAGERVTLTEVGLFSDGTAVKLVGEETFRLCRELLDEVLTVDTDALCAAIKDVFQDTRSVLEPAGVARRGGREAVCGSARASRGKTLVAMTSGANMNFDRLRFVAERAEVGEAREAVFAVTIPGGARQLPALLRTGRHAQRHRIQLPHRAMRTPRTSSSACRSAAAAKSAQMLTRVRRARFRDRRPDARRTVEAAYPLHGRRPLAARARRTAATASSFPERPGALMKFLVVDGAELEHQPVPLPQPGRRITARFWSASRCRRRKMPSSSASSRRSAIRIGTKARIRSTSCSSPESRCQAFTLEDKLVVAISSRALFDFEEENAGLRDRRRRRLHAAAARAARRAGASPASPSR